MMVAENALAAVRKSVAEPLTENIIVTNAGIAIVQTETLQEIGTTTELQSAKASTARTRRLMLLPS